MARGRWSSGRVRPGRAPWRARQSAWRGVRGGWGAREAGGVGPTRPVSNLIWEKVARLPPELPPGYVRREARGRRTPPNPTSMERARVSLDGRSPTPRLSYETRHRPKLQYFRWSADTSP